MSKNKKRILMVGEASYLNTGYSTYAFELLKRLYKTGKYELAELGCFGKAENHKMPWLFYSNLPDPNSEKENEIYNSNKLNSFGAWKFEKVLLDFKPDIVIDIRDHWMCLKSCGITTYTGYKDIKDIQKD